MILKDFALEIGLRVRWYKSTCRIPGMWFVKQIPLNTVHPIENPWHSASWRIPGHMEADLQRETFQDHENSY